MTKVLWAAGTFLISCFCFGQANENLGAPANAIVPDPPKSGCKSLEHDRKVAMTAKDEYLKSLNMLRTALTDHDPESFLDTYTLCQGIEFDSKAPDKEKALVSAIQAVTADPDVQARCYSAFESALSGGKFDPSELCVSSTALQGKFIGGNGGQNTSQYGHCKKDSLKLIKAKAKMDKTKEDVARDQLNCKDEKEEKEKKKEKKIRSPTKGTPSNSLLSVYQVFL